MGINRLRLSVTNYEETLANRRGWKVGIVCC